MSVTSLHRPLVTAVVVIPAVGEVIVTRVVMVEVVVVVVVLTVTYVGEVVVLVVVLLVGVRVVVVVTRCPCTISPIVSTMASPYARGIAIISPRNDGAYLDQNSR